MHAALCSWFPLSPSCGSLLSWGYQPINMPKTGIVGNVWCILACVQAKQAQSPIINMNQAARKLQCRSGMGPFLPQNYASFEVAFSVVWTKKLHCHVTRLTRENVRRRGYSLDSSYTKQPKMMHVILGKQKRCILQHGLHRLLLVTPWTVASSMRTESLRSIAVVISIQDINHLF
jgi:hypothetical protein